MAKLTEKEVQEIFGIKTAGLPDEQRTFINAMVGAFTDAINKSNNGLISDEVLTKRLTELSKQMSDNNTQALAELRKENAELVKQLKSTAETVEKLKQKGISMHTINKFDEKLQAMFDSEKFQDFAAGNTRKSGQFDGFSLKEVVSMTDNYEGTHLITQQQSRVVSPIANKPLHMREILQVLTGDPAFPNLAYTQVDSMDRNARYVTENGRLPESSIKTKEVQTGTKRLGTHMRISKRMLKSRAYLRSYILAMMPEAVYMAEDWNILFGDGNGENLLGIANHKGVLPVEKIITDNIVEGKAGSVQSVTAYNGGADALVEFTNPQPLVLDGMAITFTGATSNANLNATHNVVKVTDRQVLLIGVAITEEEAAAASSEAGKAMNLQIGDSSDSFNQMNVSVGDMHVDAMGTEGGAKIADIDIGTQEGAAAAVQTIKDAINYVSSVRGDLGAIQNRLEHTANNLSVMAENIQDAESTIRDTDVAEEMMSYTKNNILVQSAQAMLAQANQLPQGVLQLLG